MVIFENACAESENDCPEKFLRGGDADSGINYVGRRHRRKI